MATRRLRVLGRSRPRVSAAGSQPQTEQANAPAEYRKREIPSNQRKKASAIKVSTAANGRICSDQASGGGVGTSSGRERGGKPSSAGSGSATNASGDMRAGGNAGAGGDGAIAAGLAAQPSAPGPSSMARSCEQPGQGQ